MAFNALQLYCLLLLVTVSQANTCYQCASKDLKQNWQLTGYPIQIPDELFNTACDSKTTLTTWTGTANGNVPPANAVVDCNSACIQLSVQHPDQSGTDNGFVLRGCLDKLMGYDPQAPTDTCEYGKNWLKYNSKGVEVPTQAVFTTCAGDKCNLGDIWLTKTLQASCGAAKNVQCYKCTTGDNDCSSGSCNDGNYCLKTYAQFADKEVREVYKTCSPINPYGNKNRCTKVSTNQFVPVKARLSYQADVCYCTTNYCNSATSVVSSLAFLFVALIIGKYCY